MNVMHFQSSCMRLNNVSYLQTLQFQLRYWVCNVVVIVSLFTQPPMRWMRICFTHVFFLIFCFFSVRHKNTRQPSSGTAERIFMKLLPNDSGENVVSNVVPKWGLGPQLIFGG